MRGLSLVFFALLLITGNAYSQILVKGNITDENGEPLIGATVAVKGTTTGTTVDVTGAFSLEVPSEESSLVISFIGYNTKTVKVGDQENFDIQLELNIEELAEVVVIGYGTVKKSDLTGSIGSVDVEQLQKFATVDVNRTIQGKVAGVQVTTNSGAPGSGTSVRVRGVGSFSNADPLYVVDGFLTGDISNIAPNDIESMEVLKDASATAIYGSRGSNGVIIITTKQGTKRGVTVDLNTYVGTQQAWKTIDMLDAPTYAQAYLESVGGRISAISESDLRSWIQEGGSGAISGTNWQDEVLQNALVQSYDVSARGGFNKLRYKLSAAYFNQEGIVVNTFSDRTQANLNLAYDLSESLTITGDVKYSVNDWTSYDQGTYSSVLGTALRKDPINPVRDPITGHWDRTGLTDIPNPARLAYQQQYKLNESVRIQPSLSVRLKLMEGLTLNSSVNWDDREIVFDNLTPANTTVQSKVLDANGIPSVNPNESLINQLYLKDLNTLRVFQNTNTLNYEKNINDHSINAMVGLESYQEKTSFNRDQLFTDSMNNIQYSESAFNLLSYFARAVYSYNDRYLVTATLRRDGSSKFPKDGRWGTFPSFSVGWNVDREKFFPTSDFITGLKFRAGWGSVGNQSAIAPFRFYSTLSPDWNYSFNNQTPSEGFAATFLPASTITWEQSVMTNVGVDLYLLENMLSITAEYYIKDTEDLLVDAQNVPSPVFAGALAPASNAASMQNKGFELTLDYKQLFDDFSFNVGGNISFINNEVTSLGAGERIEGAGYEAKIGMPMTRTIVGGEFASFYGLQTLGVFQDQQEIDNHGVQPLASPGDIIYNDVDGNGAITPEDAVLIGSALPDFTYGFYLNAAYKGFDLSVSFTGSQGNDIANIFAFYSAGSSALEGNLTQDRWDNRWTGPGSTNSNPRVSNAATAANNDLFSDRYIEDGSFLRLRNMQLGYTIPSWIYSKLGINNLRVYLSADNLLTFTNYSGFDPEVGLAFNGDPFGNGVDLGNYPQSRTIIFGLNVKF